MEHQISVSRLRRAKIASKKYRFVARYLLFIQVDFNNDFVLIKSF